MKTLQELSKRDKQRAMEFMNATYQAEGCGICKKPGADVFWFCPYSRCAHKACYDKIKNAETRLMEQIAIHFPKDFVDYGDQNNAHIEAIRAVEQRLAEDAKKSSSPPLTLLEYLDKNGEEATSALLYWEGMVGVVLYKKLGTSE